jgi:hypothetical protein
MWCRDDTTKTKDKTMTKIRSIITAIVKASAAAMKSGLGFNSNPEGLLTIATYVRRLGLSEAWLKKWGSALGRLTAKTYRKATGTEPMTMWVFKGRRVRTHMAYPADSTALRIAIASYITKTVSEVA